MVPIAAPAPTSAIIETAPGGDMISVTSAEPVRRARQRITAVVDSRAHSWLRRVDGWLHGADRADDQNDQEAQRLLAENVPAKF